MTEKSICCLLLCMMFLCICASPASSRPWKPTPNELAADYATINDNRGTDKNGNVSVVMIMWMVPQRFPEGTPLRQTFEKYVVIGVAHAHIAGSTGTMTFDKNDMLQPKDGNGNLLTQLIRDSIPPTLAGAMTTMDGVLRQSLGAFGKGITWFMLELAWIV